MKINSNITAYTTNNAYLHNERRLSTASERLSSGFKINRAGDDPANYAIGSRMRAQLEALDKVKTNATTGISVVETAESAVSEIQSMILRMSELAIKAANGTMSTSDRAMVQEEVDQLKQEITRISETSEFNGMNLLNGDFENKGYCRNNKEIGVENYSDETPSGVYDIMFSYQKGFSLDSYSVSGEVYDIFKTSFPSVSVETASPGNYIVTVSAEQPDGTVISEPYAVTKAEIEANNGVVSVASTIDSSKSLVFSFQEYYKYEVNNSTTDKSNLGIKKATDLFNTDYRTTTWTTGDIDHVTVTSKNGAEVTFEINREKLKTDPGHVIDEDVNGKGTFNTSMEIDITGKGAMRLQVGPDEGEVLALSIPEMSLTKLRIADLDMTTMRDATLGIDKLKEALAYANSARSKLGAYDNRLENTISFVNASNETMSGSYSRIMDTDMAEEMTEYTNLQVLTQAGMSMLAQANEFPQQALQLLQ